jgi:hypothetical protein
VYIRTASVRITFAKRNFNTNVPVLPLLTRTAVAHFGREIVKTR